MHHTTKALRKKKRQKDKDKKTKHRIDKKWICNNVIKSGAWVLRNMRSGNVNGSDAE